MLFTGRGTILLSPPHIRLSNSRTAAAASSILLLSPKQQQQQHRMSSGSANIPTPSTCYVDFCLVPVGTGNVSVAREVADVQKVLKASGLKYTMHSAGTTVEGSWDDVMKVIGQAHAVVHQGGVQRVQTSMRVGTRTDKTQTAEDKVKRVQDILANDESQ
ncbi:YkoF-like protein [Podospora didyma]|uniref:YkoF-like protein n=1 Tax=Podospora didyma TaxID=330526 RepID=A0AAE0KEK1_9PEZI|nr:YkoF-like protein [Podospora didyma]